MQVFYDCQSKETNRPLFLQQCNVADANVVEHIKNIYDEGEWDEESA